MKILITIIVCLASVFLMETASLFASNGNPSDQDEVHIGPNGVAMPLERILLIRGDQDYCAIKFTRFWTGKTVEDRYAAYESYYDSDNAGDFSGKNVKVAQNQLRSAKPSFSIFGHPIAFGENEEIECGPFSLWWTGRGSVYFFKKYQEQGDYGIELAPTQWANLKEVNLNDPRIEWYRYDTKRLRVNIPINSLWKDKDDGKE